MINALRQHTAIGGANCDQRRRRDGVVFGSVLELHLLDQAVNHRIGIGCVAEGRGDDTAAGDDGERGHEIGAVVGALLVARVFFHRVAVVDHGPFAHA